MKTKFIRLLKIAAIITLLPLALSVAERPFLNPGKRPVLSLPFGGLLDGGSRNYMGIGYFIADHSTQKIWNKPTAGNPSPPPIYNSGYSVRFWNPILWPLNQGRFEMPANQTVEPARKTRVADGRR
jgi:hypothetical protein